MFLLTSFLVFLLLFLIYKRYFGYWTRHSVSEIRGYFTESFLNRGISVMSWDTSNYNSLKGQQIGGMWEMCQPVLYLRDLDLIKQIFTKDFDHFVNRRTFPTDNEKDHTKLMLSFRETDDWKNLRNILTPAFSTVKMRRLFLLFDNCAQRFMSYLKEKSNEPIEFRNAMGKYTMSCIAESVFGIDCYPFQEPPSEFFRVGKVYMDFTPARVFKLMFVSNYPKFSSFLGLNVFDQMADEYLTQVVHNVLESRKGSKGGEYNDFLEIMRENSEEMEATGKKVLSEHEIVAQCMNFFAAGSDSIETVLIWAAYELAKNPEIQARLYKEVVEGMPEGTLTFDKMNDMEYLDMFVSECLRIYPPTMRAERRCLKDYTIPGTKYTVPKGQFVHIPIYPIHHDPEYWPDPWKFDPERFSKENKGKGNQFAYLPFGHGPRTCIAARYSIVETKVCITHMIKNFVIKTCDKTEAKPTYFHLSLKPLNGTWLSLIPRS